MLILPRAIARDVIDTRNRSQMSIIADILEAAKDEGEYGASRTKIMYKAFLSYEQLKQYLPILIDNEVLHYDEETRTLKITEKGFRFLQIYHEIRKHTMEEQKTTTTTNLGAERKKEKEVVPEIRIANRDNNNNKPLARLLIVDDDSDIVKVLKHGLEINGYDVDAYSSSQKALDSFKPNTYDLAILDIRMPALSGFQLYREIKRRDSAITVCFLSAFEVHPSEFENMFPSMSEVKTIIRKPVSINHLIREIIPLLRISAIARAYSGEHLLVAFETPQELIEQSLQFLKTGLLKQEEDILLVTDELPKNAIREKIAKEWNIADVNSLEEQGRITLMTFAEWHLIDNKFDAKRGKTMMLKMAQKALDKGRKGLRFANDANSFFVRGMIGELVDWELSFEKQFDLPITFLCAYSEDNVINQLDNSTMKVIQQQHNRMRLPRYTA